MKLYEFEGHKLLAKVGIQSPFFVVVSDLEEVEAARKRLKFPIVAKVQVLTGKRGKSGGVKICTNEKQLVDFATKHLGKSFPAEGDEEVRYLILAEKVDIDHEYYVSINYDTVLASPFILFSDAGGMDIEEVSREFPEKIARVDFDVLVGPSKKDLEKLTGKFRVYSSSDRQRVEKGRVESSRQSSNSMNNLADVILRLWDAFSKYDARLVEINPLVLTKNNEYLAVDAKVILDDAGMGRHNDIDVLPKGAISAVPSKLEFEAREIDREDYRGSAGSTFIELDGDIAILASGGGASLLVMDSVVAAGGDPAKYTEYFG